MARVLTVDVASDKEKRSSGSKKFWFLGGGMLGLRAHGWLRCMVPVELDSGPFSHTLNSIVEQL